MRTTLTLDPDVAAMLEAEAARIRAPFKQVVNEAIRRGLAPRPVRAGRKRFLVAPFKSHLVEGVDARKLTELADELEDEGRAIKLGAGPKGSPGMIIPDLNLLLYAYFERYPQHAAAKDWWEETVNGADIVGIAPPVAFGFVRLATNRKVYAPPIGVEEALGTVESWFQNANVQCLVASPRNLEIAFGLLRSEGTAGSLTTDAQIAAFAIEHQATLCSNDTDFGRFAGLKWSNPLAR